VSALAIALSAAAFELLLGLGVGYLIRRGGR